MRTFLFIILIVFFSCCSKAVFQPKWTNDKAPENFTARFETSKGVFDIQVNRTSSPMAVDRFYQFTKHHLYDNTLFYRVVPDFVVQFGNSDTTQTGPWNKFKISDEKVLKSNIKGALSYARDGKDTRGNDLFINLKNNSRLDTVNYNGVKGFPSFGTVVKGMEVVESIYSGYGNATMDQYDSLSPNRAKFLKTFPKLDSIKKVYILKRRL
ncbi:peptidylprolyl isomerase [Flavobacterium sp. Arc3]|uniref:peptidylprolyl isomerase n=1 Tax=Flavobacterium sp. Arc3 TaxID=3046686 RepID=UPI00352FACAA